MSYNHAHHTRWMDEGGAEKESLYVDTNNRIIAKILSYIDGPSIVVH